MHKGQFTYIDLMSEETSKLKSFIRDSSTYV